MSGPCTVEIAGFDEFVASMFHDEYDVIVFDTAPTGHTLRLLELPSAWSAHIEESAKGSGQTCIGPVDQLQTSKEEYDRAMNLLRDGSLTHFVFVAQPERTSVVETLRASAELRELGIANQRLIMNGVIPEDAAQHPFFASRRAMQLAQIEEISRSFPTGTATVPLLDGEVKGIAMLRRLGRWVDVDAYAIS